MSRAIDVRPATSADADAIATLYIELKQHHAEIQPSNPRYQVPEERWRKIAAEAIARGEVLVAETDGAVIGFVRTSYSERPWGKACEVNTLVVDGKARGAGVGGILMSAAEEAAAAAGAKGIRLDILVGNDDGVTFYEKLGYELFAWRYGKMMDD